MGAPKLIVISGPSGCGKTTIAREVLKRHPGLHFSVSATTRPERANETDGKDYYFISNDAFQEKILKGELAEWERIYDDYYGTPRSEIEEAISAGRSVILDVDVKGALSLKRKYDQSSVLIFIKPPSMEVLKQRLMGRKTESPDALRKRLERVAMELELAGKFDYVVVNDKLEVAVRETEQIVIAAIGAVA